jgi:hypothetical protein
MLFPNVSGSNLQRNKIKLPDDFEGTLNVVLVAFQQWQQSHIDTWLPFVEDLEQNFPELRYYEVPVIRRMNILSRTFINEGMRAGIPNPKARERTVTLYLDKANFRQALGMPHEQNIYVLLLDQQGQVLWKREGEFTNEAGEALKIAIEENLHLQN